MTIVNPGNPNTGSFAVERVRDGSPLDPYNPEGVGTATFYERLDVADPDPNHAAGRAAMRLFSLAGGVHTMQLRVVPQPWLEPGETVVVEYNGGRAAGQISAWSWSDAGEMTVTLRGWRVASDWDIPEYPDWPAGRLSINAAMPLGVDEPDPVPVPVPAEMPVETS